MTWILPAWNGQYSRFLSVMTPVEYCSVIFWPCVMNSRALKGPVECAACWLPLLSSLYLSLSLPAVLYTTFSLLSLLPSSLYVSFSLWFPLPSSHFILNSSSFPLAEVFIANRPMLLLLNKERPQRLLREILWLPAHPHCSHRGLCVCACTSSTSQLLSSSSPAKWLSLGENSFRLHSHSNWWC